MKKNTFILTLFLVTICTWSCNNDLDLIDEWKNIPVVYGLLSKSDEVHYIRVEKAFLDPNTSGLEIAQNPDSLYYGDNVAVEIERVETGDKVRLERVDGSDFGLDREDGIFATEPNILYRFSDSDLPLITNETYRLIITDGDTDEILTEATTNVVGEFEAISGQPSNPIFFNMAGSVRFGWRINDSNGDIDRTAVLFDVRVRMRYREQVIGDPSSSQDKELVWLVAQNIERDIGNGGLSPQITTTVTGSDFYKFIAANVDQNPNLVRIFENVDIEIDAAGPEILDFITIGQANTGITSAQEVPIYTNLSNEGIGLFSSRSKTVLSEYNINSETRDSLRDGSFTSELNFQ